MEIKQKVLFKINELNKSLKEIEEIKSNNFEEYSKSIEKKRACERLLQVSIEALIDSIYIIYKSKSLGIPKNDISVIEELYKEKIINKKAKDLLKNLNSFRNVLVHKYGSVDDELVFENIKENLDDFRYLKDYLKKVIKIL